MLEELSATHSMTYTELGNMPATIIAQLWESYSIRSGLQQLEADQRSIMAALYANGNMDEKAMRESTEKIEETFREAKIRLLYPEERVDDDDDLVTDKWW